MSRAQTNPRSRAFTLIEMMIVVAIIGILAATAIPNFRRFQFRSKSAEAKTNLAAIRTAEVAHLAEFGFYVPASPSPPAYGGGRAIPFVDTGMTGANFHTIGFQPEGLIVFQYAVSVAGGAYTAEAAADIDGNMVPQIWGYLMTDVSGNTAPGTLGCPGVWSPSSGMAELTNVVGPCGRTFGLSEF
jgi:type IV pilus assembly protein PilA